MTNVYRVVEVGTPVGKVYLNPDRVGAVMPAMDPQGRAIPGVSMVMVDGVAVGVPLTTASMASKLWGLEPPEDKRPGISLAN